MASCILFGSFKQDELPSQKTPSICKVILLPTHIYGSSPKKLEIPIISKSADTLPISFKFKSFDKFNLQSKQQLSSRINKGLINTGNTCFLNSTIQILLACDPFYFFLNKIFQIINKSNLSEQFTKENFPALERLASFSSQFQIKSSQPNKGTTGSGTINPAPYFDKILHKFDPSRSKGANARQEDSQEFLSFILNELSEEFINNSEKSKILTSQNQTTEEDGWMEKTKKNKTNTIRLETNFPDTPITQIFSWKFRSRFHEIGKIASVTIERFYVVPLNINSQKVRNLEGAISEFLEPENFEVGKKKSYEIEQSPEILVFQLKRFLYDQETYRPYKLHKSIEFPEILDLKKNSSVSKKILGQTGNLARDRFELFGVLTHFGESTTSGHYICDIKKNDNVKTGAPNNKFSWQEFDDTKISSVPTHTVLQRCAYLLFYKKIKK